MKTVILCGGKGTRLKEETEFRPKALVMIGDKPIIWHIMKTYAHYGFNEFIICLGYKGHMLKEYFLNYQALNNDFTVSLGECNKISYHSEHEELDWTVTLVNTGDEALTGSRVKRIEKYVTEDSFMVTYGDGVGDVDIAQLVKKHKESGKIGVVTGVYASSRFAILDNEKGLVKSFKEKPYVQDEFVNGGFFVFKKDFFKYLSPEDDCCLERQPLEKLAADAQLVRYDHNGYWQCADTYRELEMLKHLWQTGKAQWKVWS